MAAARRRDRSGRSPATIVRTASRRLYRSARVKKKATMAAARRRDRSGRSPVATRVLIPAPIMLRKMKRILSHRRRRDVAKPAKSWGLRSRRRMPVSLLPFHIVASILSWLPVKSLLRFRRVCKEWRSLTYNPSFIKEHHTCARALGRLSLISKRCLSSKILLYDFGDNGEVRNQAFNMRFGDLHGYRISNPVNGLICCGYSNSNRYDEGYHYLLNPATRELAMLPTSGNGPWDTCTSLGLGFDSSTGGYKLVKLFHIEGDLYHCGCKVLEVGTQEWRDVGRAPCGIPLSQPVLLNGDLHWVSRRSPTVNSNFTEMTIAAFNLKDGNFRLIPVPKCRAHITQVSLVEWEGLLCLVKLTNIYLPGRGCASMTGRRCLLRTWRREENASCRWSEAHRSEVSNNASIDDRLSLVGIRGHEILLAMIRGRESGSICSYDLCTRNLRELYREHSSGLLFLTESLVSPRYLAGDVSPH